MKFIRLLSVDWILLFPVILLSVIGFLTISSFNVAEVRMVTDSLVIKHGFFVLVGVILSLLVSQMDYRLLHRLSRNIFWITLLLLILVIFIGVNIKGSTRWLYIGPFGFQPTELAKIATIILMSKYIATYHRSFTTKFRSIIFSGMPVFIFMILIILQPDLGSALIILLLWFGMIVFGGTKISHVIYLSLIGLITGIVSWFFVLQPYQKQRVITFLDPLADPLGSGFNTVQSLRAVASGGLMGRGVGAGNQAIIVPEVHTDFIFSGFAQEWGFVGISVYFLILFWIFIRLFFIVKGTPDVFSKSIVIGVSLILLLQNFVNIGMNLGLMPITGTPLPFISHGGSAMLTFFTMIGLVLSIQKHKQAEGTIHMRNSYEMWG